MANPWVALIGWPVYSDVGLVQTPTVNGGSWVATLPLANLLNSEIANVARSTTASLSDTRFRVDLRTDRPVRVTGLLYRSPEHPGAPTTAARIRYLGVPSSAQDVLFTDEGGDDAIANGATFTRATAANYIDPNGVLRSEASGKPRESHFVAGLRARLLEAASTNLVVQSENFGTTWLFSGTPTRVAAAHTASGVTLDLIGDDAAGTLEGYAGIPVFTGNAVKAVSLFVKQGTSAESVVRLIDTTASAIRLQASITWSGGLPVVTMTTGTYVGILNTLAGGVFRLGFVSTSVTAANGHQAQVWPATTSAMGGGQTGDIYAGGVQAEDAASPTSYIKTTTATVARNADSLSFPTIATAGTIYQKYWDVATLQFVETTSVYSSGAAIPFTTGRAYVSTRIAAGTKTQAEMQALVFDSGWFTPFPAGLTIEDTEDQNIVAWAFPPTARVMRYVSCQIDDAANTAGFVDLNRFAVTGGIQPGAGMVIGSKISLETATQLNDSDTSVTSAVRKPTRRRVECLFKDQDTAEAFAQHFLFQRIAGTDRQFWFIWNPTDTTLLLHQRSMLATLSKLSDFEQQIGIDWGIGSALREAL